MLSDDLSDRILTLSSDEINHHLVDTSHDGYIDSEEFLMYMYALHEIMGPRSFEETYADILWHLQQHAQDLAPEAGGRQYKRPDVLAEDVYQSGIYFLGWEGVGCRYLRFKTCMKLFRHAIPSIFWSF